MVCGQDGAGDFGRSGRAGFGRAPFRAAGFTLLEVLVGLVVAGFIFVGLAQGFQFGLKTLALQDRSVALGSELEPVDRGLRRLIEQIDPSGEPPQPPLIGTRDALFFVSSLPESVEPAVLRRAEMRLSVDAAHRFVLSWRAAPHAVRLIAARPETTVLLSGVQRLEASYFGPSGWVDVWRQDGLPDLVRLRLVFMPGDRRHWPDIVAAPRLSAVSE